MPATNSFLRRRGRSYGANRLNTRLKVKTALVQKLHGETAEGCAGKRKSARVRAYAALQLAALAGETHNKHKSVIRNTNLHPKSMREETPESRAVVHATNRAMEGIRGEEQERGNAEDRLKRLKARTIATIMQ